MTNTIRVDTQYTISYETEMIWVDDIVLGLYPPQKNVICPVCNHKDRIYV